MRFLFVSIAFLCLCLNVSARAETIDDGSLQNLLKATDDALGGHTSAPASRTTKRKHNRNVKPAVPPTNSPAPVSEQTAPPARLAPFENAGVQEILSVDLTKQRQERDGLESKTAIRIGFGVDRIGSGYRLTKDDDTFSSRDHSSLLGLYIQYNPSWPLTIFSSQTIRTRFTAALGSGYFSGDVLVDRIGVQLAKRTYQRSLIPVDAEAGISVGIGSSFFIDVLYGLGLELVHQEGEGTSDTTSRLFWGDQISFGPRVSFSSSLDLSLRFNQRGLLVRPRETPIGGFMMTAALGFAFAG